MQSIARAAPATLTTGPEVLSINRSTAGPGSLGYTVSFSEPVTGVDASDFQVVTGGTAAYSRPLIVSGTGSSYTVTLNGVSGAGTLGLNLIDDGSVRDAAGRPIASATSANFIGPTTVAASGSPFFVLTADLNGDGVQDLIVGSRTTQFNGFVTVMLGNGDGTFRAASTYAFPGDYLESIAIADMNSDGVPDLLVTLNPFEANTVELMLGNGNGTFQVPQRIFSTGPDGPTGIESLATADFNGDGRPDIVLTDSFGEYVALNNGNGTFLAVRKIATVGAQAVAVADVNGDGIADLVLPGGVLLGNGNGTFLPLQSFSTGSGYGGDVAVGDLNGDGIPDVAVTHPGNGTVGVILGKGDGTFQPAQTIAVGVSPTWLTISDVNGDGKADLITSNGSRNNLAALLGNGDGTFQSRQTFPAAPVPACVAVSDLNNDGRSDLVAASYQSGSLDVYLGGPANFAGQVFAVGALPALDTIGGTGAADQITLVQDPDGEHVDWTMGVSAGQLAINHPNGLTINGDGGNDVISLDYSNGDPLPASLHLNGTFVLNGLHGTNPLAGTTLDINRSTLFISYTSSDPIAAIQSYLRNAYNNGVWTGTPTATTGVVTSLAAQSNGSHNTAIGYADWADGQGIDTIPYTIEMKYTLIGDANLDTNVNSADLQILLFGLNHPGAWDQGDFNYDGQVNSADLQTLLFTLNTSLGSQATPLAVAAAAAVTTPPSAGGSGSSDPSPHLVPAIHTAGPAGPVVHHPNPSTVSARKRR